MINAKEIIKNLLDKRKLLLIVPLLVVIITTIFLWSAGIIGNKEDLNDPLSQGLNVNLPGPGRAKDSSWNKLNFYEQANKDSIKLRSLLKNDPNFLEKITRNDKSGFDALGFDTSRYASSYDPYSLNSTNHQDSNEAQVYNKLTQLQAVINHKPAVGATYSSAPIDIRSQPVTRLDQGLEGGQRLSSSSLSKYDYANSETDPELTQISGMLDKILDIQHPDRVKQTLTGTSNGSIHKATPVRRNRDSQLASLLQSNNSQVNQELYENDSTLAYTRHNAFYTTSAFVQDSEISQVLIKASIPETQSIITGATIKLQLRDDVFINGLLIPASQSIYGKVILEEDRLKIAISSLRFRDKIIPVALSIYDEDGLEGINIPGSMARDVAKQSADQALQGLSIASLDPSLGAQAASAGIQAAKTLIGRKTKSIKVTVKAGYQVFLKDVSDHNQ